MPSNTSTHRRLVAALLLLPLLVACQEQQAAPPPAKLCDDIPYQWAADATARTGLTTMNVDGRIAVTPQDNNGDCSIQNADKVPVLSFTVQLRDATFADKIATDVEDRLSTGNGVPLATPQGKGLVLSREPDSDKVLNSYWICAGVTLDVSMKDANDPDKAAERLKTFTERVAALVPCIPPAKM
jgi:hypothetical protein